MKPACMRAAAAAAVLLSLWTAVGCRKKEPPRGTAGEAVDLNALGEIQHYQEILRKDPNNLQALINVGNLYSDTGQDRPAIEHYRRALVLDPRNANVRTAMAICYRRRGDPDKAIEELKKAISIDPKHAPSRNNLGLILIHDKHDVEGGVQAWEALLENIPDYPYRDSLRSEIARMRATIDSVPARSR